MDDQYYSKKLDQYFPTRLDVLLYAHDGRGLGHASRAIAIGMALRRLYPELRVLFVTGAKISQSLIANADLDWIKLPSYASMIKDGVSTGVDGPANFYKSVLGNHRKAMLAQLVRSFKPRCVLVDHSPTGKRKELMQALEESKDLDIKWILGIRAIVGTQSDFWSDTLRDVYQKYYHSIFWYGDSNVLGSEQVEKIHGHFGSKPEEMGYVSRMYETKLINAKAPEQITGTISIPWVSQATLMTLEKLQKALHARSAEEQWHLYIHEDYFQQTKQLFAGTPNCTVYQVGHQYVESLLSSKMVIIYGGYNSLMDAISTQTPALVLDREMKDQEQEIHLQSLIQKSSGTIFSLNENHCNHTTINKKIDSLLGVINKFPIFNFIGSENSSEQLFKLSQ